ncbi:MAG: T9SS type A sorting domain-containing protein [Ignavibacteriales bacterium]|nr:T9SS type A sorting domain-containing protein [Ignavibacteriales bacterium]
MKRKIVVIVLLASCIATFSQTIPRAREEWSKPKRIWSIFAAGGGTMPTLSGDEKTMYYQNSYVYGKICRVEKTDTGWGTPQLITPRVNSQSEKGRPIVAPDGKTFYFSSGNALMRCYWDSTENDWGQPAPLMENGLGYPTGGPWDVCNFLNDTTMIVLDWWDARITSVDKSTGQWRKPRAFPGPVGLFWTSGLFVPTDTMKAYEGGNYNVFTNYDMYVSFYSLEVKHYTLPYRLNLSYMSDSLKATGEYYGNNEEALYLTKDGKTMYFGANYHGKLTIYESHMLINDQGDTLLPSGETGIRQPMPGKTMVLFSAYPNPFNPSTNIRYVISERCTVVLRVYDMLGKEVATLYNGEKPAGAHEAVFDASNLPTGVYLVRLKTNRAEQTLKVSMIK